MRYIIFAIVFLTLNSFAQKWDKTYGTTYYDEYFEDLVECYDHGYLISGSNDLSPYPNLLIKTDINGSILWEKTIQHANYSIAKGAIDQNCSGEIAIARCLNFPNGDQWPSIIKLDSCGNKLWCRVYIDDEYNSGSIQDVILCENGDVLALGYMQSLENFDERIFLWYIETNGNLLWRKSYASKEDHPLIMERIATRLQKYGSQYIISGRCWYPYPANPNVGYKRPFFIGVNNEFKEEWILPFGVNEMIVGRSYDVIALNDSIYMGTGSSIIGGGESISLFIYFTSKGDVLGHFQIPNDAIGLNYVKNITTDIEHTKDNFFITSTAFELSGSERYFGEMIIDTVGNIFGMETHPNTGGISAMIKTFDNKFVTGCNYEYANGNEDIYLYKINDSLQMDTVYPGSYTYDSLCPYQIESGTIDITDCLLITDVGETPGPKEYFASLNTIIIKAYPNPVKNENVTFDFQNTSLYQEMELKCFDVFGREVYAEKVYQNQGECKVNASGWNEGMYFAIIVHNSKPIGNCKFIIK